MSQTSRHTTSRSSGGASEKAPSPPPPIPRWRFALYSLFPVVLLFVATEVTVRVARLDVPRIHNAGLPEEFVGLLRLDPDLFWSLKPNLSQMSQAALVQTNELGLRSAPLHPKRPGEFRILSLGESSTFGAGVGNSENYTAVLQDVLQARKPDRAFCTINAGVSSYSSFQSLKYLELRGLALKPDLVLFYHEVNDYLPSTLRDSSDNEIGALRSDRQLYDSRTSTLHRALLHSAVFRFLTCRLAAARLEGFRNRKVPSPLTAVGLPGIGIQDRLFEHRDGQRVAVQLPEVAIGRRVTDEERLENLRELVRFTREKGVRLVIVHPSYRDSRRHECILTRFCRDSGTPMFEAYDALHPPDLPATSLFWDRWHPTRQGHRRLAEALGKFLLDRGFLASGG